MKRQMIETGNTILSKSAQCRLLELSRSSFYYQLQPEDEFNLYLMGLIDQQYTKQPFMVLVKLQYLRRQGNRVNYKRVERLMGKWALWPSIPSLIPVSKTKTIKYIHICCGICRLSIPIKFGAPI